MTHEELGLAVLWMFTACHLLHVEERHEGVGQRGWCAVRADRTVELVTEDEGAQRWSIGVRTLPEWALAWVRRMRSCERSAPRPAAEAGAPSPGHPERLMVPSRLLREVRTTPPTVAGVPRDFAALVRGADAPIRFAPRGSPVWHRPDQREAEELLRLLAQARCGRIRLTLQDRERGQQVQVTWEHCTDGWREVSLVDEVHTLVVRAEPRVLAGRLLLALGSAMTPERYPARAPGEERAGS